MYHSGGGCCNEGSYAYVRAEGIWEIPVPSAQVFCEPKTALKKNEIFPKKGKLEKRYGPIRKRLRREKRGRQDLITWRRGLSTELGELHEEEPGLRTIENLA